MSSKKSTMDFVPMTSITKKAIKEFDKCSDWVATEKVHGSSFQFYTSDGVTLNVASRNRRLDKDGSFVRCNIKDILRDYEAPALRLWHLVHSEDTWTPFRDTPVWVGEDSEEEEEDDKKANDVEENTTTKDTDDGGGGGGDKTEDVCHVRIYGELYGGGGINKGIKSAVQKEIIYCDEFRVYVFGVTINYRWVNVAQLGDLCERAGFPFYAKPVCAPMPTPEDIREWINEVGFLKARSALTEKEGDEKTSMEGVVMTPLTRPNYRLYAMKYLFPAFNDVREAQFGHSKTANFCTQQRYHSVISKLDIPEREDTEKVVELFIQDIIKECPDKNPCSKLRGIWRGMVLKWLAADGYLDNAEAAEMKMREDEEEASRKAKGQKSNGENSNSNSGISKREMDRARGEEIRRARKEEAERREKERAEEEKKEEGEQEEDGDMGLGFFDL